MGKATYANVWQPVATDFDHQIVVVKAHGSTEDSKIKKNSRIE